MYNVFQKTLTGGVITSQTTLCRNFGGKGGGGVLAGHYGTAYVTEHHEDATTTSVILSQLFPFPCFQVARQHETHAEGSACILSIHFLLLQPAMSAESIMQLLGYPPLNFLQCNPGSKFQCCSTIW